jgi:hypothetical protein
MNARVSSLVLVVMAVACSNGEKTSTSSTGVTVSARIWLTDSVLARLRERAAAADPAWATLSGHCDAVAKGAVSLPTGNAYPDLPNIGQGYQGDGYLPEVFALGLCYRTAAGVDDAAAARWGQAGARVLSAMATPVGSGGQTPSTDDGYGMRNYGVGMAVGYDWLRPALDDPTRASIASALDTWIGWYDASGFSKDEPVGNYFAGYLFAKGAAAIALEGDYASATGWWADVSARMWTKLVKPAYGAGLAGGGWPEGWQYGPRAVQNVVGLLWAANTAKGLSWWSDVPLAHDEAAYVAEFAWPSRKHMDDRGTVHAQAVLSPSASTVAMMATVLDQQSDPFAATARGVAADLLAATGESLEPWQSFLFWDPQAVARPTAGLPTSYVAKGPGHVAMRSSWAADATWASFASGPYIDAPDSGEQYFDAGGLAIARGDSPVLVNATGWLPQADGDAGEQLVYDDTWGNRTRLLDNTFYVAGATQVGPDPTQSSTHVERVEDGGGWVRARGAMIEQMYAPSGVVTQFTRDVVYVRPGTFVVYDRTTAAGGGADQWIAWHVPGTPVQSLTSGGSPRFDIATGGTIRALLPRVATASTVSVGGGAVTRIEVHASASSEDWLTAVNVGESPDVERLSSEDGNIASGPLVGAHIRSTAREAVVLFASDHRASAPLTGGDYVLSQATDAEHVVFDVAPSATGYGVTATAIAGGQLAIHIAPGGPLKPTAQGTLDFIVSASGKVTAPQC